MEHTRNDIDIIRKYQSCYDDRNYGDTGFVTFVVDHDTTNIRTGIECTRIYRVPIHHVHLPILTMADTGD